MSSPLEMPPLYAVLFTPGPGEGRDQDRSPYVPVVLERPAVAESTGPHGLAKTVAAVLPGLWYCLHLPASLADLIDVDACKLKVFQRLRLDHHILLAPIDCFDKDLIGHRLQYHHPVVTICPDELLDEAQQRVSSLGFALPTTPYSQLSDAALTAQWKAMHQHFIPDVEALTAEVSLTRRLDLASLTLPHRRLARQMGWPTTELSDEDTSVSEALKQALWGQTVLAATACLERGELPRARPSVVSPRQSRKKQPDCSYRSYWACPVPLRPLPATPTAVSDDAKRTPGLPLARTIHGRSHCTNALITWSNEQPSNSR